MHTHCARHSADSLCTTPFETASQQIEYFSKDLCGDRQAVGGGCQREWAVLSHHFSLPPDVEPYVYDHQSRDKILGFYSSKAVLSQLCGEIMIHRSEPTICRQGNAGHFCFLGKVDRQETWLCFKGQEVQAADRRPVCEGIMQTYCSWVRIISYNWFKE